nr:uncharacterized protein LOC127308949 isoform X1 [Lolium perenne]
MEYSGRASPVATPRALPASRELHSFALQYRSRARLTIAPSMGMGDGDPRLPRDLFLWFSEVLYGRFTSMSSFIIQMSPWRIPDGQGRSRDKEVPVASEPHGQAAASIMELQFIFVYLLDSILLIWECCCLHLGTNPRLFLDSVQAQVDLHIFIPGIFYLIHLLLVIVIFYVEHKVWMAVLLWALPEKTALEAISHRRDRKIHSQCGCAYPRASPRGLCWSCILGGGDWRLPWIWVLRFPLFFDLGPHFFTASGLRLGFTWRPPSSSSHIFWLQEDFSSRNLNY